MLATQTTTEDKHRNSTDYAYADADAVAVADADAYANVHAHASTSLKAESPRRNGNRTSSFFRLNQQSHKTIPQLRVSIEDLTYFPVNASTATRAGRTTLTSKHPHQKRNRNRTVVLDTINTEIHPFELTGWMGPSGSGKTSLISVAAGLVEASDIPSGSIKVNQNEGAVPKQQVGVVWQDDLLLSNLTVEETIYFAARLKTPSSVSDDDVKILVEETMRELGLLHLRNSLIGSATSSSSSSSSSNVPRISGGERKRTSVAVELVVRPPLLLCDEPTSGLDATTALSLMKTLRDLASLGHSIVVVIHQPRTDIFHMLNRLLLLSKGQVVYDGQTSNVRSYLEGLPSVTPLPPETGIADWIMDTIIEDEQQQQRQQQQQPPSLRNKNSSDDENDSISHTICGSERLSLADYWTKRLALRDDDDKHESSHNSHPSNNGITRLEKSHTPTKYEASFGRELTMLINRISKQQRGDKLTIASLLLTLTYLAFTGFLYWRLPDDTSNVYERNSLLFFLLIAQGMGIVTTSISVFHRERALLRRERAKKLYRVLPFFLAKVASDSTNNIFLPLVYGIVTYWTSGLKQSVGSFLRFSLGYYLSLSCAQSMGFFLSILYPDMALAMLLAPPITLFMFISAGFYIPFHNMNAVMKWLSYGSFARYGYSALLINEYEGREIPCPENNCELSGIAIGGSNNECPLLGDRVYESIGLDGVFASYWFNIGILAIFQVLFLVGAYVLMRRSK
jgi:ABC-type multidrug transport system ATPase subunit